MGTLRYILALSVILAHTGGIYGYTIVGGGVAVQCFYIVSGFFITLILTEKYNTSNLNKVFYINRVLRIYVLYYVFLTLYAVYEIGSFLLFHKGVISYYAHTDIGTLWKAALALSNITVIGQDASLFLKISGQNLVPALNFNQSSPEVFRFMLILPAWSLSLELLFYVMAPFIVRRTAWVIAAVCAICLAIRLTGFTYGLSGDPWSYRFFPFELGTFLLGALGYKAYAKYKAFPAFQRAAKFSFLLPAFVLIGAPLLHVASAAIFFDVNRIVTLGLVAIGTPLLFALSGTWKVDRLVGEMSFPLYLGHELVIHFVKRSHWLTGHQNILSILVAAASTVLAFVVMRTVDIPINHYRDRLARRAKVQTGAHTAEPIFRTGSSSHS